MKKKILITGASGLLGKTLVNLFIKKDFFVLAQYHKNPQNPQKNCHWLFADFSDLAGIRTFLEENKSQFKECSYLVNNYGPIGVKKTGDLTSEDFISDYYHNLVSAYEITTSLIRTSKLQSVVNIGFEYVGMEKVYKTVLPYALSKNSLLLLTQSLAQAYPGIHFNLVSPVTIRGARVEQKNSPPVSAEQVALVIYQVITSSSTGQNVLVSHDF